MLHNSMLALASTLLSLSLSLSSLASAYTPLSDDSLRGLTVPAGAFDIKNKETSLLAPILVPRVSGTEGNRQVQRYFLDFFAQQLPAWNVSTHTTTSRTPATGSTDVPFTNIIATRDPPWARPGHTSYLTLVAHFDSKRTPDGFIGATDSAAPCAMLLHAARELDAALTARWDAVRAHGVDDFETPQGLQVLLLDGEEAMVQWTDTDSLYGARALARDWASSGGDYGAMSAFPNRLGSISLFVLLDLLGAPQPAAHVPSYYRTTHWAYQAMAKIERKMRDMKVWASSSPDLFLGEAGKSETDPHSRWLGGLIGDDHVPFISRGVEVLHLISNPFPRVWHTMADDGEHLDIPTVEDWAKLVTAFTAEWMDLEGFLKKPVKQERDVPTDKSEL